MIDALTKPVRIEVPKRSTSSQWAAIKSSSILPATSGLISGPGSTPNK